MALAVIGTVWFIRSLPPRDPMMFSVLLPIPLISLRQAWKIDRQIVACKKIPSSCEDPSTAAKAGD
jgi:hypothetical protein